MWLVLIYAQITSGESSGNGHVIKVYETRNSYVLCDLKLLNPVYTTQPVVNPVVQPV